MWGVRHERIVADKLVLPGPGRYYGGILLATSGGAATVLVRDGRSSTTGELLDRFSAAASGHDTHGPNYPLRFEVGLAVDLGSNVDEFVVFYVTDGEARADLADPDRGPYSSG